MSVSMARESNLIERRSDFPHPSPVGSTPLPVTSAPRSRSWFREFGIPLLLLAISIVTTTAIGARFMQNFKDGLPSVASESDVWPWPWLLQNPTNFSLGWPFSFALLGILMAHEFGHYIACRLHGIDATLPWVLPAPTLSGTAGAVIQIRGRIPSRGALMDVGIYGPLAGYCVSLVAVIVGFLLSHTALPNQPASLIGFGEPLTIRIVHSLVNAVHPGVPAFASALRHPVLIAGWVGLFITSLNLIPGGQLDGGHVLYALWPGLHKKVTWLLPIALILCGIYFWVGWILWGLLLFIPAMRHPRVAVEPPLNRSRMILGWVAALLFVLTFSVEPFSASSVLHYLR